MAIIKILTDRRRVPWHKVARRLETVASSYGYAEGSSLI